jgi:hypothetical protein
VALDKSEGVVKRHGEDAVRWCTVDISRAVRTGALEKIMVNHSAVESFHQPSIRSRTATMIRLCESRCGASGRERPINHFGGGFQLGSLHYRTGDGGGGVGGTGYWYNDLQNSYNDWINAIPVDCWPGDGFRDPNMPGCGGDGSSSGSGGEGGIGVDSFGGDSSRCGIKYTGCLLEADNAFRECKNSVSIFAVIAGMYCITKCNYALADPTGSAYVSCLSACGLTATSVGASTWIGCHVGLILWQDKCERDLEDCHKKPGA